MKRIACLALVSACIGSDFETFEMSQIEYTPYDVLFVIDDTVAMQGWPNTVNAERLAQWIPTTMDRSTLRLAVTTTTTGTLRTSALVPSGILEQRIDMVGSERLLNYEVPLAEALDSLLDVGASSTAPNAIFDSTLSALDTQFGREDAEALGIVVISARDDQSVAAPEEYAAKLRKHADRVMVSSLIGTSPRMEALQSNLEFSYAQPFTSYEDERLWWSLGDMATPIEVPDRYCLPVAATDDDACVISASHVTARTLTSCTGDLGQLTEMCYELRDTDACDTGYALYINGPLTAYRPLVRGGCFVR